MDLDYKCGLIIKGEFHNIEIEQLSTRILEIDPPWVGHLQQSREISFDEYKNGEMVVISKKWGIEEVKKVGEIPENLLQEIMKKKDSLFPII
ncbi:hypothetical protein ACTHS9_01665 [Bacillus mycoides]|uniref:hypothetical protein n=1 Tax=Bacillus mycoides TaxID=1405 RepID=UPI003F7BB0E4